MIRRISARLHLAAVVVGCALLICLFIITEKDRTP